MKATKAAAICSKHIRHRLVVCFVEWIWSTELDSCGVVPCDQYWGCGGCRCHYHQPQNKVRGGLLVWRAQSIKVAGIILEGHVGRPLYMRASNVSLGDTDQTLHGTRADLFLLQLDFSVGNSLSLNGGGRWGGRGGSLLIGRYCSLNVFEELKQPQRFILKFWRVM